MFFLFKMIFCIFLGHSTENLNYIETGDENKPSILFVHGTPGSLQAYEGYYNDPALQEKYHLVSIDRIGFGKSSKKSEGSLSVHAKSIISLLNEKWPQKKFNCMGHSYGVPVCLKMFILEPERFNAGLFFAGAVNPNRKILRWYNYLASTWVVKLFLSRGFENSNDEMKSLKKELFILEKDLDKIDKSILIIHGKKDSIVPFEDSEYLEKMLINAKLTIFSPETMGHLFLWKQQEYLKEKINSFLL